MKEKIVFYSNDEGVESVDAEGGVCHEMLWGKWKWEQKSEHEIKWHSHDEGVNAEGGLS